MEIKAQLRHLRIAPRKVGLVTSLILGLSAKDAVNQLRVMSKRSSNPILKLLNSAIANAKNNFGINEDDLYVAHISVNKGVTLKRWLPRAFGRASAINKRSSHISLVLKSRTSKVAAKKSKTSVNLTEVKKVDTKDKKVVSGKEASGDKRTSRPALKEVNKAQGTSSIVKKVFRRKAI